MILSYIEQLLAALLLASVVVGGIMFIIGWFIAYLIDHKGDIQLSHPHDQESQKEGE